MQGALYSESSGVDEQRALRARGGGGQLPNMNMKRMMIILKKSRGEKPCYLKCLNFIVFSLLGGESKTL